MKTGGVVALLMILLVLALGVWAFINYWGNEIVPPAPPPGNTGNTQKPTLAIEHGFFGGLHLYRGTIDLPTPCHTIAIESRVAESFPEQITLAITTRERQGVCAQVVTPTPFSTTVQASREARVSATLNGAPVQLQLEEMRAVVTFPDLTQTLKSPLLIKGMARGLYFEASFPIHIEDKAGTIIAQAPAQAQGDWMTSEPVPFEATLTFAKQAVPREVLLVIENDNPSGLPEHLIRYEIPVRIQ